MTFCPKRLTAALAAVALALTLGRAMHAAVVPRAGISVFYEQKGVVVYDQYCAKCHARDGAGLKFFRDKGQPDFTNPRWQKKETDSELRKSITEGKGKLMPAFKEILKDDEISAVLGRVRDFSRKSDSK